MKKFSFASRDLRIALLALIGLGVYFALRSSSLSSIPLWVVLVLGGTPLVWELLGKLTKREFGSDLLAGISIVVSVLLGEYLAGVLVVLMLSGGAALESYAVGRASSVLEALAQRIPNVAHRKRETDFEDIACEVLQVEDVVLVFPHEICPVDGVVIEGMGSMDESYLTGEPYVVPKTPGVSVLSGAINGDMTLTIRATKPPIDSRYQKIAQVMQETARHRAPMRRIADQLGAVYTPVALCIAGIAWAVSGDPIRFLATLVIATPCPLLIAIPVAIIGAISLSAKKSIIIRDPAILEQVDLCRTIILDKTGTLTYGRPEVSAVIAFSGFEENAVLRLVASLERYSKHPLAAAILQEAEKRHLSFAPVSEASELAGEGLRGEVEGNSVRVVGRKQLRIENRTEELALLPPLESGLECIALIGGQLAGVFQMHDAPRLESRSFIKHLGPKHQFSRALIVSGDRETEVRYLAQLVGIEEVYAGKSPEEKLEIVREETRKAPTLYIGDGINDAPALLTATVGIALGGQHEVAAEAAGAVVMDASLERVDMFFHIARRMRAIALQSALGGMALSIVGMLFAASGHLSPVAGAVGQEVIDVLAILNALRASQAPAHLSDFEPVASSVPKGKEATKAQA